MATIITKNSTGSGVIPSSLIQGELAINVKDGRLFYGSGSGNVVKEFTGGAPTFPFTGSAIISGSLTVTGSFYVSKSIDSVNKYLIDNGGVASVRWNDYRLYNSSNDLIIHWGTGNLYSGSFATASVSWTDRLLRSSTGINIFDWENGEIKDTGDVGSLSTSNRRAFDGGGNASIEWSSRILNYSFVSPSLDWEQSILYDQNSLLSYDWNRRRLLDPSEAISIDYEARTLVANDGTTIAADWSTPGTITLSGSLIPAGPYTANTSSYDLGSPTAAWRDLYVSNGSINLISGSQSASISFTNGALDFGSTPISSPDVIATASVSSNTITFTKGDGTTFPITVNTGSGGSSQTLLQKASAGYEYYNDFLSTPTTTGTSDGQGYIFLFSGTGASIISSTTPGVRANNQHGFVRPATGTQTTGYSGLYGGVSGNQLIVGGGIMVFQTSVLFNTLSNGTERYRSTIGYGDQSTSTAEANGVFFTYDEGGVWNGTVASPNWQCVTVANSVRTLTTTSVAVSTTAWHTLKTEINADGTSVAFYINDTLVATHTTNIPSGSTRPVTPKSQIVKTLGTTSRFFHMDYLYYSQTYTTPKSL